MDIYIKEFIEICPPGTKRCALEDSIMQKGQTVAAGSKMLENFVSPIDAAVVLRLISAGVLITGKTKMDEFGVGAVTVSEQETASGAAAAVAEGYADFALCNDFSGNVRRQAARLGLCYIHPTYGTVSRFGLIPAVASMDQIGVISKTAAEGFSALEIIAGRDECDGAMLPDAKYTYKPNITAIRAVLPDNALKLATENECAGIRNAAERFETINLDLPYFDVYSQVMYILSCAELSNNINRYDGIKFGYRASDYNGLEELYTKSRTEAFGAEVKLSAIMGALVLSQENYGKYYDKAMRIRRLIKESFNFNNYDIILLPVGEGLDPYTRSALYALPQLTGFPSITGSADGTKIQLVAYAGNENMLFSAAEALGL